MTARRRKEDSIKHMYILWGIRISVGIFLCLITYAATGITADIIDVEDRCVIRWVEAKKERDVNYQRLEKMVLRLEDKQERQHGETSRTLMKILERVNQ